MLSELFQAMSEQAVKAAKPTALHIPGDPPHVHWLPPGFERHDSEPLPRAHIAADLSAIIAFAKENERASIFYDRNQVTCLLDDTDRRDRIEVPLLGSPQLLELLRWEEAGAGGVTFSQRDLILRLRTLFRRCLGPCPFLVDSIRKVRFEAGGVVTGDVGKHKSSLSREMIAKVTGEADLVEEFSLSVPIFDGVLPQILGTVTIAMDADAANATAPFRLIPIAGDLEAAQCNAEQAIGNLLADGLSDDTTRLYYGKA